MATKKDSSPTLDLDLGGERLQHAIDSNSGACLIADAIREQYPHLTRVEVDMATIRVTDVKRGYRFTYLTPPDAQHVLLSFDQGWPQPVERLVVQRAVHRRVITSTATAPSRLKKAAAAAARLEEITQKAASGGDLSREEKMVLTRAAKRGSGAGSGSGTAPERPTTRGPVRVVDPGNDRGKPPIIEGGDGLMMGPAHPNLLRGRNRFYGAKLADPGKAFREAVEAAIRERDAEAS